MNVLKIATIVNRKLKIKDRALVNKIIIETFNEMRDAVTKGEDVKIKNFGSFKKTITKGRYIDNKFTKKRIHIDAYYRINFSISNNLKQILKKQTVYKGK